MKKLIPLLLTLALLAGCGASATTPAQEQAIMEQQQPVASFEPAAPAVEPEAPAPAVEPAPAAPTPAVTLTYTEKTGTVENDDGIPALIAKGSFPVAEVGGNLTATDAINGYFSEVMRQFDEDTATYAAEAKDDYKQSPDSRKQYWNGYALERCYAATRVNGCLSFSCEEYVDLMGAHPSTTRTGVSFALDTGKKLAFADVVSDEKAGREFVNAFLLTQFQSDEYKDAMFDGYENDLDQILTDDTWYFSEEGFVVIVNTYIVTPYAAGIMEFTVPYADFALLKPEYLPA